MVDISKLKKKSRLGTPPSSSAVKNNLRQPEILEEEIDKRTLRKTGRTHQLATRVTPDFYNKIRIIAARDRIKIVELLERAIDIYEKDSS